MKDSFHTTLLKRIAASPDFPAFAKTVQEAYRLIENELASTHELVELILRDPALTHRILRLANAVEYRHLGGQVTTISRAVSLLGFEEVRMAALAMSLFEQIQSEHHARQLQSRFLQALYQAFLAKDMAKRLGGFPTEEMFLSALFQDLGALLIYRHAPEKLNEIERARHDEGLDESTAIQKVTGVLPVALAREVCQQWGLPDSAKRFLTQIGSAGHLSRMNPKNRAQALGQMANAMAAVMAEGASFAEIQKETDHLAHSYGIDINLVNEAAVHSREQILEYESMLTRSHDRPAFLARISLNPEESLAAENAELATKPEERSELLIGCINDITSRLMGDYDLGETFNAILKAMAEGLDLDMAVLYMLDRKNWQLVPKMGIGKPFTRLRKQMDVSLHDDSRIAQAFLTGEDQVIHRPSLPMDDVLSWQLQGGHGRVALAYPLHVNRSPFGLFYLEGHEAVFHPGNTNSLRTLRNQSVLAIKGKSTS